MKIPDLNFVAGDQRNNRHPSDIRYAFFQGKITIKRQNEIKICIKIGTVKITSYYL